MDRTLANWNGEEMDLEDVRVPALDRSFLFGDGVYEVIRVYGGRPWKLDEHVSRLRDSLAALKIEPVSLEELRARTLTTLAHSGAGEALIYIQVSRGAARRTHHYPDRCTANELIYVERFDDPYRQGRDTGVRVITYPDIRWTKNHIKAVSLLANCMAAQAAAEAGCVEAILIDQRGLVTEGSHTSVFAVEGGSLVVSPDSANVLPGITKRQVLALAARAGVPVTEKRVAADEIGALDEMFLSGTPEEILAITHVDGKPVGAGLPGPVTRTLQKAFAASVSDWLGAQATGREA
jgi:D-alanine transaminase